MSKENKTVGALLEIEVWARCPHCNFYIDLMDEADTNGHNHNEEGHVIGQACPDGHWTERHKKFEVGSVTCSECKKDFDVKGLSW